MALVIVGVVLPVLVCLHSICICICKLVISYRVIVWLIWPKVITTKVGFVPIRPIPSTAVRPSPRSLKIQIRASDPDSLVLFGKVVVNFLAVN